MSRFYVPEEKIHDRQAVIDGREARHILNVMRLDVDDEVVFFNETGKEYEGRIHRVLPGSLIVDIITVREDKDEDVLPVTLYQAIPKKGKMDYIVEKATELGVQRIVPMVTKRTVVVLDPRKSAERMRRWRTIAQEASKQCGRSHLPEIADIHAFRDAIRVAKDHAFALFAWIGKETVSFKKAMAAYPGGSIAVFIGPEGDFTPEEASDVREHTGCRSVSLGTKILKSDTAGLYVLSCLHYELND